MVLYVTWQLSLQTYIDRQKENDKL
jgi:hypothetical protein